MAKRKAEKAVARALSEVATAKDAAARLAAARAVREAAEALEQALVDESRAAGATWSEIGAAYGMTKQAAQQRFRGRH